MSLSKGGIRLVFGLAALHSGLCAGGTFACPERIEATSTLSAIHGDWEAVQAPVPQYFERISLTSGPPQQQASLVPDASTKRSVVWKLADKDEYWVACHYLFSNLLLTRKLPQGLRECSVKLLPAGTKAVQQDRSLVCQ